MLAAGKVGTAPGTTVIGMRRRYWPYQDINLKNNGLGIIDPHDWWHTGRPYGLPGTTAIRMTRGGGMVLAGLDDPLPGHAPGFDVGPLDINIPGFDVPPDLQFDPLTWGWEKPHVSIGVGPLVNPLAPGADSGTNWMPWLLGAAAVGAGYFLFFRGK